MRSAHVALPGKERVQDEVLLVAADAVLGGPRRAPVEPRAEARSRDVAFARRVNLVKVAAGRGDADAPVAASRVEKAEHRVQRLLCEARANVRRRGRAQVLVARVDGRGATVVDGEGVALGRVAEDGPQGERRVERAGASAVALLAAGANVVVGRVAVVLGVAII